MLKWIKQVDSNCTCWTANISVSHFAADHKPATTNAIVDRPHLTIATDRPQKVASIDALRTCLVVLVVAHHAILAYAQISPTVTPRGPFSWLTGVPVVDSQRLPGLDMLVLLDDTWLMALMFFLSGLFVAPSLAHKGGRNFLRNRALRLGLPFVAVSLLMPLAYYPAYRLTSADPGALGFWREWISVGAWPSGPLWFIGLLLQFDVIVVLLYRFAPTVMERARGLVVDGRQRPTAVFVALLLASAAAYMPALIVFGPDSWALVGLVPVQGSRVLFQLVYFLAGVAIGSYGVGHGLLAPDGRLVQRWYGWAMVALVPFSVYVALYTALALPQPANAPLAAQLVVGSSFVISCATISFAVLAIFVRFVNTSAPVVDSLNRSSYGIYLFHYGLVMWMQYALVTATIPPLAKAAVVLTIAVAASWMITAALRRIPAVAKVI